MRGTTGKRESKWLATGLVGLLLTGCGGSPEPGAGMKPVTPSASEAVQAAQQMTNQPTAPVNTALSSGGAFVPPAGPVDQTAPGGFQLPTAAPGTETVKAQAGVGAQGRSLDQHEGLIVTPAKTYFKVKERVAFEIAIPQALNLYIATNGDGPKTHAEFMQKIVIENNIQLPKLPEGHVYEYDPEQKELMVRRPQAGAAPAPAPNP